ncbi:molybdopterin-dependent oxidoreductase [Salipiger sp. P9]|uniref:molybdopterin-dependent oxidoreductase n=1 Tax=Salipiger pentaromativorans TaxID=2943193 RepID=UPI002157E081|nr:molybdopterin-dependent oxidoreductase [Salipiger pentaromativorans]MCR8550790.1 molybdopterin-dependent oxidoreductase [Salipiger pentaromativorans]
MTFLRTLRSAAAAMLLLTLPLAAADLDTPTGPPLLTVSGAIDHTNDGVTAVFDLAMLEAMERRSFTTRTIWTNGEQHFTGVSLRHLMEAVGARGGHLRAIAINDYAVDIPREDWEADGPIVAYRNNGAPMSVRHKGPLWIVYPYDSDPAYRSEKIYARSIWQLARIAVRE